MQWLELAGLIYLSIGAILAAMAIPQVKSGETSIPTIVFIFIGWIPILFLGFVALMILAVKGD
jgi:hypothetical protein